VMVPPETEFGATILRARDKRQDFSFKVCGSPDLRIGEEGS